MSEAENVGIFLCTCEKELSKNIDIKGVARGLKGKARVIEVVDALCNDDGLVHIAQHLRWEDKRKLDEVVVAACSYRDKGRVFEKLLDHYDVDASALWIVNLKGGQWGDDKKEATENATTAVIKTVHEIDVGEPKRLRTSPELCANRALAEKDLDITGCELCSACPLEAVDPLFASYHESVCVECGICASLCPQGVFRLADYTDGKIMARMEEALDNGSDPRILVFSCENNIETTGKDDALSPVFLPCIGAINENHIFRAFDLGADGVAILGCGSKCENKGAAVAGRQAKFAGDVLKAFGIEKRIKLIQVDADKPQRFEQSMEKFAEEIRALGPTKLKDMEPAALAQGKRDVLITLTEGYSKKLGIVPEISIDGTKKFSDLSIGQSCTNCGACALHCATGALKMADEKIIFTHAYCTECGICEHVCPEDAIVLDGNLHLEKFVRRTEDVFEQELAKCLKCGTPFIPKNMLVKIKKAMESGQVDAKNIEMLEYCRKCKDDILVESMFD